VDYDITLFGEITFTKVINLPQATIIEYPVGHQRESLVAGDFKYSLSSEAEFFEDKPAFTETSTISSRSETGLALEEANSVSSILYIIIASYVP
jgi:hypothetical protein